MTYRALLLAALVGLLGSQAPLCVLACTADATQSVEREMAHDLARQMPCHEGETPSTRAADANDSSAHVDCGCSVASRVFVAATNAPGQATAAAFLPPRGIGHQLAAPLGVQPPRIDGARHIPPPDILLLKSTLLI